MSVSVDLLSKLRYREYAAMNRHAEGVRMKEKFEEMVVEVVTFEGEDIITTSDSCTCDNQTMEIPA